MLEFDQDGMAQDARIVLRRAPGIEHGALQKVHALVVHQTDSATAAATLAGYQQSSNGAHFLIGRDGVIYQTASIKQRCYHVGRHIKSKCLELKGAGCNDPAMVKIRTLGWTRMIAQLDALERSKSYPERFPVNSDSLGIELVGRHIDDKSYQAVTTAQNDSLHWLVAELAATLSIGTDDVYRHPAVSYKNPGEAATAVWK